MSKIPKDRQIIIKDKNEIESVAQWSEADKKFATAIFQLDLFEGKWNMGYFENEYITESEIVGWREL